jgi:hypothetical protein
VLGHTGTATESPEEELDVDVVDELVVVEDELVVDEDEVVEDEEVVELLDELLVDTEPWYSRTLLLL